MCLHVKWCHTLRHSMVTTTFSAAVVRRLLRLLHNNNSRQRPQSITIQRQLTGMKERCRINTTGQYHSVTVMLIHSETTKLQNDYHINLMDMQYTGWQPPSLQYVHINQRSMHHKRAGTYRKQFLISGHKKFRTRRIRCNIIQQLLTMQI